MPRKKKDTGEPLATPTPSSPSESRQTSSDASLPAEAQTSAPSVPKPRRRTKKAQTVPETSSDKPVPAETEVSPPTRSTKSSKAAFLKLFAPPVHDGPLPDVKEGLKLRQEASASARQGANPSTDALEEHTPTPFMAKKLLPARVWPFSWQPLDLRLFMVLRPDHVFRPENRPHTSGILDHNEAGRILARLQREIMYPTVKKDFAPRVLEAFTLSEQHAISDLEAQRIKPQTILRLAGYLKNTTIPSHHASQLVGRTYIYILPQIASAPEPLSQPQTMIAENGMSAPPNDDLAALFAELGEPIEAFDYSNFDGEPQALAYIHTVNHCGRIMAHIKHWALHLAQIDQEVKRPSDQMPLAHVYYTRFIQIRATDNATAAQHQTLLPDERLKLKYDLDEMDLLILWLIASLQIDQDVRECLVPTWTQGNLILFSPATIMRFLATNQMEKSELMFRLSASSRLRTHDLVRTTFTRNPILPLYFELSVPEQIQLQFAGTLSLSTPTSRHATLIYPSLSKDTFLSLEHQHTLQIVRHFVTRPALNQTNPQLSRENLNFIPSLPFLIEGLPGSGRTTLMKIIASRLEMPLIIVSCGPLSMMAPEDFSSYFNDLFQDAELLNALVCLKNASTILADARHISLFTDQLAIHPVVCAMCVDLPQTITPELDPYVTFKTKMDANLKENAVDYWKPHLSLPFANNLHVDVLDLSRKLALQPFQIQKATRLAYYATATEDETPESDSLAANDSDIFLSNQILEHAASVQITKNIGNLAFITDPEVTLSDVIVSDDIMKKIKLIIGSAQTRRRVLYEWGLSRRIRRGTGVICLFDGDPGTGKTHSAEAIAKCLGLSLMRVNIASMVDKYIGETEKNLTKIFEQARPDMSLLLFDEADSLFTKRTSNVSKSNDRYSNMSVNVLLQLVERYEGVSVLTTNLKNSIDPAFERRITYKIYFPMPKKEERIRLWKYMCPPDVVTAEPLDYDWLSEIEMSGGEIKNAVLAGAFKAATLGRLLDTEILYEAGVNEASAAGRVMRHYDEDDDGFN